MVITLLDEAKVPFHKDLYVSIPQLAISQYNDTYYFALDSGILPEEESYGKVKIVLRNLLYDWEVAVDLLIESNTVYLPIDFSDQYVGALKVFKEMPDSLIIYYSSHKMYGGMYPSLMNKIRLGDEELYVSEKYFRISTQEFLSEIRRECDKVN
ncbi:hypothetical protein [Spirosoma areae]